MWTWVFVSTLVQLGPLGEGNPAKKRHLLATLFRRISFPWVGCSKFAKFAKEGFKILEKD